MDGFPKTLKTKEDFYNCLGMVARGELAAGDLLAKIESAERQRFICCAVVEVAAEKKAVTVMYCDEAAAGMKFTAGNVSGSITAAVHKQSAEAEAEGQEGYDRTALTLSKAVPAGTDTINLETTKTVAGMSADDFNSMKGVLKQYE